MDTIEDMPTSCHYMWGPNIISRRDVRRMEQSLVETYGEQGHPALL